MINWTKIKPKALALQRNLGTRCAAGYLRNQGVTLQDALYTLLRKPAKGLV